MSVEQSSSPPPWLNTPRGRRDLIFIAVFVLLNVVIPLLIVDLYPFSRAPMFADAPQVYCNYQLYDPSGQALDVLDFGLHRNYWGNPVGEGVGFRPPRSIDEFGAVPDASVVTDHLLIRLRQRPDLRYVEVVQEVIGAVDDQKVGELPKQRLSWCVENPAYPGRQER
jgi:hypothetical protein